MRNFILIYSKEIETVEFDVEESDNGLNFTKIGTVAGYDDSRSETNHYSFIDPADFNSKAWYRIVMKSKSGAKRYSRIIQLTNEQIDFGLTNIVNPFGSELPFEVVTTGNAKIDVSLIDLFGKTIKQKSFNI